MIHDLPIIIKKQHVGIYERIYPRLSPYSRGLKHDHASQMVGQARQSNVTTTLSVYLKMRARA